ncbi:MAG TPA: TetR family transcriptional regulator [Candidatus Saccharimonadia bacterium]|jgi:AcrR family transcriptional regulator
MSEVNSISGKSLGRRPGPGDAKEAIVEAARVQFAKNGYDRTSMRQVAAEASVDPSLIVHYFGTKQRLFIESMLPLFEAPKLLPVALAGDKGTIGLRLATLFIKMTSDMSVQKLMLGVFRSVSSEEEASKMARNFVQDGIMDLVEQYLPGPNRKLQANILGGQMVGLFVARYIIKVEPLVSASPDELIEYLAPRLQAHFD